MSISTLVTPVHLDYTTLYGAALCVEPHVLGTDGLRLSRLLSLSQLVEGIVLHERLQFEVGATADWQRYNDALQETRLLRSAANIGIPLEPAVLPIDRDDEILDAFEWAAGQIRSCPFEFIDIAVRRRPSSFGNFPQRDRFSPMVQRYFQVARNADNPARRTLHEALQFLANGGIDGIGLYIVVRLRLLEKHFASTQDAMYFPHYSRQPLVVSLLERSHLDVHEWTMNRLREKRKEIFSVNEPQDASDALADRLSPVFVACLNEAQEPLDIIDNAIELRESVAARRYRQELLDLTQRFAGHDQIAIQRYKTRLNVRIQDLNDLLFEKGVRRERVSQWSFNSILQLGWVGMIRNTQTLREHPGDGSVTLLSDILSQSLGTLQAEARISEIFRSSIIDDCPIVGFSTL